MTSDRDDARELSKLGYAQELLRAMGGFSSFALSFSIISVLTGIVTTYGVAIAGGGPAALGIGWPIVSAGTIVVALAMGELASAFPTAGALYHWSAWLGGAGWGWFTAMMNLVGQLAIVAAIDLGCAKTLASTLGASGGAAYALFGLIVVTHAVLNVFSVRLVAWSNDFSATVHIVGVVVIVGALLAIPGARAHPLAWLGDTSFTARGDHAYPLGFLNALILGMWTFTGFDASAHVSEETHDPARRAPWGIVSAVLVSAVAGYALVCALTLANVDLPGTTGDDAALVVMRRALGEGAGRAAMALAIVAMWFCGLSSVTSASRMLFAFARDEGLPMHAALRSVSARWKTPHVAVIAVCGASSLIVLATASRDAAFLAIASLATTGLYTSYAVPLLLGAIARARGKWTRRGPWHLAWFGAPMAWLAVAWSAFVLVVCALPPNAIAGEMLGCTVLGLAGFYFVVVRGRFKGPRLNLDALERD